MLEQIGDTKIVYECDVDKAAYNRSCDPVKLFLRRGGKVVEATLKPVEQKPFLEKACAGGNADACFRANWLSGTARSRTRRSWRSSSPPARPAPPRRARTRG